MRSAAFYLLGKLSSTSLTASAQASICPFRNPPEQMLRATSAWEHLGIKEHAEFRGFVCSVGAGRRRQHFTEPCRASHCARRSRTCGPPRSSPQARIGPTFRRKQDPERFNSQGHPAGSNRTGTACWVTGQPRCPHLRHPGRAHTIALDLLRLQT